METTTTTATTSSSNPNPSTPTTTSESTITWENLKLPLEPPPQQLYGRHQRDDEDPIDFLFRKQEFLWDVDPNTGQLIYRTDNPLQSLNTLLPRIWRERGDFAELTISGLKKEELEKKKAAEAEAKAKAEAEAEEAKRKEEREKEKGDGGEDGGEGDGYGDNGEGKTNDGIGEETELKGGGAEAQIGKFNDGEQEGMNQEDFSQMKDQMLDRLEMARSTLLSSLHLLTILQPPPSHSHLHQSHLNLPSLEPEIPLPLPRSSLIPSSSSIIPGNIKERNLDNEGICLGSKMDEVRRAGGWLRGRSRELRESLGLPSSSSSPSSVSTSSTHIQQQQQQQQTGEKTTAEEEEEEVVEYEDDEEKSLRSNPFDSLLRLRSSGLYPLIPLGAKKGTLSSSLTGKGSEKIAKDVGVGIGLGMIDDILLNDKSKKKKKKDGKEMKGIERKKSGKVRGKVEGMGNEIVAVRMYGLEGGGGETAKKKKKKKKSSADEKGKEKAIVESAKTTDTEMEDVETRIEKNRPKDFQQPKIRHSVPTEEVGWIVGGGGNSIGTGGNNNNNDGKKRLRVLLETEGGRGVWVAPRFGEAKDGVKEKGRGKDDDDDDDDEDEGLIAREREARRTLRDEREEIFEKELFSLLFREVKELSWLNPLFDTDLIEFSWGKIKRLRIEMVPSRELNNFNDLDVTSLSPRSTHLSIILSTLFHFFLLGIYRQRVNNNRTSSNSSIPENQPSSSITPQIIDTQSQQQQQQQSSPPLLLRPILDLIVYFSRMFQIRQLLEDLVGGLVRSGYVRIFENEEEDDEARGEVQEEEEEEQQHQQQRRRRQRQTIRLDWKPVLESARDIVEMIDSLSSNSKNKIPLSLGGVAELVSSNRHKIHISFSIPSNFEITFQHITINVEDIPQARIFLTAEINKFLISNLGTYAKDVVTTRLFQFNDQSLTSSSSSTPPPGPILRLEEKQGRCSVAWGHGNSTSFRVSMDSITFSVTAEAISRFPLDLPSQIRRFDNRGNSNSNNSNSNNNNIGLFQWCEEIMQEAVSFTIN